jgi:hypothetical protein
MLKTQIEDAAYIKEVFHDKIFSLLTEEGHDLLLSSNLYVRN